MPMPTGQPSTLESYEDHWPAADRAATSKLVRLHHYGAQRRRV